MDEKLCNEKHKVIDEKFALHEKRINSHSERLDRMEVFSCRLEERISNLIVELGNLNKTIRWFMGLLIGSFIAFFFYAAQQGLIK